MLSLVDTDHILMNMKRPPKPMDLKLGPQHSCIQRWSLERWLNCEGSDILID